MLKHCLKQCSSMQKAYRVRVVRTTYGEHEQIMRDHRCRRWGLVTDRILDSKICRWPGPAGREDCRGVRRNDRKRSNQFLSHHPVSSHYLRPPHISDVRKGQFGCYLATADERSVSCLKSHISCHRLILFSSFVVTDEIDLK
jgi:hypothetical protein